MALSDFEDLLKHTIGLDPASIGSSAIERAVQQRLSACNLSDTRAYWDCVRSSETELQALIEAVVVPETWFFRDREAFVALARVVRECLRTRSHGALRLLSLPCSTGEEPYSMAMALFDAGVPADSFRVDAIDVSGRALTRARHAVYGTNSFRGHDLAFRDKHFEPVPAGYRLADAVRQQVHFQQDNLLTTGALPGSEIYDVIFCRNVLIYFDRATQRRAIEVLARLLTAAGHLFTGPSETSALLNHGFASARVPRAFAVRKQAAVVPCASKPTAIPLVRSPAGPRLGPPRTPPVPPMRTSGATPARAARPRPPSPPPAAPATGIDEAVRLADQGRMIEATAMCEEHLREHGPSAQAFHLKGLVCDAAGDEPAAGSCYRKALYLDPNHYDALIHLAFLLERQGNAEAQVLRRRARRLEQSKQAVT